ncbi:TIGR03767 family metallophosphoesterase [Luteipulveratus sp. YIM 133132]|uniref:TIGR03767 family metallophosphoesterase n=1 Tax=Luteipulveratus flavus TaxID=3031728 RepID=UPI0023AEE1C8|nr:TIGR03767 family metallophosphoesterase [Luteipulveratus sp. YIM 133132]MDE9366908.1 TIGR03767 family metallophosphoesterase [Luteipulveratus sp. YIM 133132]
MPSISRRSFLLAGAGGLGAAALSCGRGTSAHALDRALRLGAQRAVSISGTTLEQAATPMGASGYRRLTAGPGYPLAVRTDLAAGKADRDDRRTALASIVQLTDVHVLDAQSPMRFEFLHDITGSAFRPQEALGTHGAAQLVKRVNDVARGPFSGRPFDCVVSTGDNTDNHEDVELDWFLTLLSGGSVTATTGDPSHWEGVQSGGDASYYNPELTVQDRYKKAGFPTLPGFFGRTTAPHTSAGLTTPWYSVFGNHDDSIEGTLPSNFLGLDAVYTGSFKFTGFADAGSNAALQDAVRRQSTAILGTNGTMTSSWKVTPDARRRPFSPVEFIEHHRRAAYTGPGPFGHGFDEEAAATGRGYYAFPIAPGVTGIAMDSTNRAGFTEGSIGDEQWRWLKRRLQAGSSTYWDWGFRHTHAVQDEYFVLFSHHTSGSMSNLLLDPAKPEIRHAGFELLRMLHDFPNVLAWVNGHTHVNAITPQGHADPRRAFWEINTASHIDFPQQARIVDVCDNRDGTLSLFTTLIESAAPYQASYDSGAQASLASVYRELSFNDIHANHAAEGTAGDRNTELLLVDPRA